MWLSGSQSITLTSPSDLKNEMKKSGLELLVGMVKRELLVRGYSTMLSPDVRNGELLKMQSSLPDMPIETICMIQPDRNHNAFFFRIRRELESVFEEYALYAGGWWYGVDLFRPSPFAFGKIEKRGARKYVVERMGEALNMFVSFVLRGDDGLRPYERKRIKIVGCSQTTQMEA